MQLVYNCIVYIHNSHVLYMVQYSQQKADMDIQNKCVLSCGFYLPRQLFSGRKTKLNDYLVSIYLCIF